MAFSSVLFVIVAAVVQSSAPLSCDDSLSMTLASFYVSIFQIVHVTFSNEMSLCFGLSMAFFDFHQINANKCFISSLFSWEILQFSMSPFSSIICTCLIFMVSKSHGCSKNLVNIDQILLAIFFTGFFTRRKKFSTAKFSTSEDSFQLSETLVSTNFHDLFNGELIFFEYLYGFHDLFRSTGNRVPTWYYQAFFGTNSNDNNIWKLDIFEKKGSVPNNYAKIKVSLSDFIQRIERKSKQDHTYSFVISIPFQLKMVHIYVLMLEPKCTFSFGCSWCESVFRRQNDF